MIISDRAQGLWGRQGPRRRCGRPAAAAPQPRQGRPLRRGRCGGPGLKGLRPHSLTAPWRHAQPIAYMDYGPVLLWQYVLSYYIRLYEL